MKTLRFLPLVVLSLWVGLVLTSCSTKTDEAPATARYTWPPDTMMLAITAPGMITLSPVCPTGGSRDSLAWSRTYRLRLASDVQGTHWPQDTPAVYQVANVILNGKEGTCSDRHCVQLLWVPDTPAVHFERDR